MNALWEVLSDIKKEEADFVNDLALSLTGNVDHSVIDAIHANGLEKEFEPFPFCSASRGSAKNDVGRYVIICYS